MKIIFLDFDGVITTYKSGYKIDPEKVELLLKIVEETGAKIVITSSWRSYNIEETRKKLGDLSFMKYVIDVTPRLNYRDSDGDYWSVARGTEIHHWMMKHGDDVDNYVILDDEEDMLISQNSHFVLTDIYTGLSEEHVQKAIEILNGGK